MGKNPAKSSSEKREPYNQPIRVYGVSSPEGEADARALAKVVERSLRNVTLDGTIESEIGWTIAARRVRNGLTEQALARRAGVAPERIKRLEDGRGLSWRLLKRVVKALGLRLRVELV